MTNHTNGTWEELYEESYQTVLGCIGWLILLISVIIRWSTEILDFLNNKCLKLLKHLLQIILKILNYLNDCCTLMVDDIDENYPTITFKKNSKQDKDWTKYWSNRNKADKDVKVEPLKRKAEKVTEQKPVAVSYTHLTLPTNREV